MFLYIKCKMLVIFEGSVWSDSIAHTTVIYEMIICPQHKGKMQDVAT